MAQTVRMISINLSSIHSVALQYYARFMLAFQISTKNLTPPLFGIAALQAQRQNERAGIPAYRSQLPTPVAHNRETRGCGLVEYFIGSVE
jgi:hypothetical protein